jgi:hypothetical protein
MRALVLASIALSVARPFLVGAVARRLRTARPSTAFGKDAFLRGVGESPGGPT